jgi:hypothetical protein
MRPSSLAVCGFLAFLAGCPAPPEPAAPTVALPPPPPAAANAPVPAPPPPAAPQPKPDAGPPRPAGVPGTAIRFTGGDGSSKASAIVIEGAQGERDGVHSEYQYLDMLLGPQGAAWQMVQQSLFEDKGRSYDLLEIRHNGKAESYWFDITGYFGKF